MAAPDQMKPIHRLALAAADFVDEHWPLFVIIGVTLTVAFWRAEWS